MVDILDPVHFCHSIIYYVRNFLGCFCNFCFVLKELLFIFHFCRNFLRVSRVLKLDFITKKRNDAANELTHCYFTASQKFRDGQIRQVSELFIGFNVFSVFQDRGDINLHKRFCGNFDRSAKFHCLFLFAYCLFTRQFHKVVYKVLFIERTWILNLQKLTTLCNIILHNSY